MSTTTPGDVRTTCPYCGVGCGLIATPGENRSLKIKPDKTHPANEGRICSKGAALGETIGLGGRLLHPMIGDKRVNWDRALTHVARGLQRIIDRHGPDAVAFYVSGQLLTEDYYAANKLMKGFIGSGNIDTNSRLCMASAVAAHTQAFGGDFVPGCYEDIDLADLVVMTGHNAAWTHPVLFRRMEAARNHGQRHVVIDPRRTETADVADLHLPLAPQMDVRLWNGLLADLIRRNAIDRTYIAAHVSGFHDIEVALSEADQSVSAVAADCGVEPADLERFFRMFAETPRTVSLFSMGANQSAQGVAKGLSVINAHLATGRIGKPGACPFSITGQPNAMGGRETGGMANTLAAHMGFDDASRDRVQRFWSSPTIAPKPGLKAVDMFEAIHDGRIKAVWVMATNPAVSLPNSNRIREALAKCPLVIVSDCMAETDTMAFAHVKLPAMAWSEKDGSVTNSERRISRQRASLPAAGEARSDWSIIAGVGARMGHRDAFVWRNQADVFREYARLTAYENLGPEGNGRLLDLSSLVGMTDADYDAFEPAQWPLRSRAGTPRLFTDRVFPRPDGRARMVAVRAKGPAEPVSLRYPLSLNTGRIRDQWHTMTRTALSPALMRHIPEPFVEIHPQDAAASGVIDGRLTCIETARGETVALARVTDRQRRGSIFMPMHWTDAFAPSARCNANVSGPVDPVSGQPEFKHTPARIYGYRETWAGFYIAREAAPLPKGADVIWRRIPQAGAHLHEFAGRGDASERDLISKALLRDAEGDFVRFDDPAARSSRQAWISNGRLDRVLFFGQRLPPRDWLVTAFAEEQLSDDTRRFLLHGRAPNAVLDTSPIVCACAGITSRTITSAISAGACTLDAVGETTRAGMTCGSCRTEISRLIAEAPAPANLKTENRNAA
ncbi:MAG TPA: molybdopterin-dependent oxidoreductase [Hyphomonadaceae bacterium]|jgi:assimilatory nitrate reductase catalytic subunit|nr:molybdopterin-dependent oxidoreductase [Hyphomonadaceae bacterium]